MYKSIPSSDSEYAPPERAKKGNDKPVSHGGSMSHAGVLGGNPGRNKVQADNCMSHGEREPECSGVMGHHS